MGNAGTDHAKATHRAMVLGGRLVIGRVLHLLMIVCHVMARHLGRLRLGNDAVQRVLCECHLQGHDVSRHDKAWQPANQQQAETFSHIGLR